MKNEMVIHWVFRLDIGILGLLLTQIPSLWWEGTIWTSWKAYWRFYDKYEQHLQSEYVQQAVGEEVYFRWWKELWGWLFDV